MYYLKGFTVQNKRSRSYIRTWRVQVPILKEHRTKNCTVELESYGLWSFTKFGKDLGNKLDYMYIFSGTKLPLRKSITMNRNAVGTSAEVGGAAE